MTARRVLFWLVLTAVPAAADTDFTDLDPADRRILGHEIREVLLTVPELLPRDGAAAQPSPYAAEIASDLARIEAQAAKLFAPGLPGFGPRDAGRTIAFFTAPDCPACARAEAELRDLAAAHDLRVTRIDMAARPDLAAALELDMAPSYVFPTMMLRGHIPPVVLRRYLAE